MSRSKQRRRGNFRGQSLPGRGSREGHVQGKGGVTVEEPGEAALGGGEQAGLFGRSDFLLRAPGASKVLHGKKTYTDFCPLPCSSLSSILLAATCKVMGQFIARWSVVQDRDAGGWDAGCGSGDGEERMN